MSLDEIVACNYREILERVAAASARVGRDAKEVSLVAVTKYARVEWVQALVRCGAIELGESRPQQLAERAEKFDEPVHWHLIGPLQRNKVRMILALAEMIHSVDSVRLLAAIDRVAGELGLRPRVLLEVNLTGETARHGFAADELRSASGDIKGFQNVRIEGLMAMAAYSETPEDARPTFSALRALRDELRDRLAGSLPLAQLSMGMSGDFEIGVEEGATIVRVGSALWKGLEGAA